MGLFETSVVHKNKGGYLLFMSNLMCKVNINKQGRLYAGRIC